MIEAASTGIYRVTVKGKFVELSDKAHQYLLAASPEHTRFKSAYTAEGTFVYDSDVKFFSLRYEVRSSAVDSTDSPADDAAQKALIEAQSFLSTMGFAHGGLDASVVDLTAMWTEAPSE